MKTKEKISISASMGQIFHIEEQEARVLQSLPEYKVRCFNCQENNKQILRELKHKCQAMLEYVKSGNSVIVGINPK